jgi:hypothetical protein
MQVMISYKVKPGSAAHHRLASFQRYRSTLDERCEQPPVVTVLHEVGSYGFALTRVPGTRDGRRD